MESRVPSLLRPSRSLIGPFSPQHEERRFSKPAELHNRLNRRGNRYQLRNIGSGPRVPVIRNNHGSGLDASTLLQELIFAEQDDETLVTLGRNISFVMSSIGGGLVFLIFVCLVASTKHIMVGLLAPRAVWKGMNITIAEGSIVNIFLRQDCQPTPH